MTQRQDFSLEFKDKLIWNVSFGKGRTRNMFNHGGWEGDWTKPSFCHVQAKAIVFLHHHWSPLTSDLQQLCPEQIRGKEKLLALFVTEEMSTKLPRSSVQTAGRSFLIPDRSSRLFLSVVIGSGCSRTTDMVELRISANCPHPVFIFF